MNAKYFLFFSFFLFFVASVAAVPPIPHAFYGEVSGAEDSCIVCVQLEGKIDCVEIVDGTYGIDRKLIAQGSQAGQEIEFFIDDNYATETAVYIPGGLDEIDLSFDGVSCEEITTTPNNGGSNSGGSGGSNNGGSSSTVTSINDDDPVALEQGSANRYIVNSDPIIAVNFVMSGDVNNFEFMQVDMDAPLAGMTPFDGEMYSMHDLDVNFNQDMMVLAEIEFVVDQQWLNQQNIDPNDVQLFRYTEGGWTDLPTTHLGSSNGQEQFLAATPGFSVFAIGVASAATNQAICGNDLCEASEDATSCPADCAEIAQQQEDVRTTESNLNQITGNVAGSGIQTFPLWIIIALVVVVVAAGIGSYKYSKKRKLD
jgi:PGF-pre-PGF domain-containing protein